MPDDIVSELWPNQNLMEQVIRIVHTPSGSRVVVVWALDQLLELDAIHGGRSLEIGAGFRLPRSDGRAPLELGGDYPGLFRHLAEFSQTYRGVGYKWAGVHIALSPTHPDEPCGILGGNWPDGSFRACLYFDKQSGREQFAVYASVSEAMAHGIKVSIPYLEKSTLPESGGDQVAELGPETARWLCFWFQMYLYKTGNIR